MGKTKSTTDLRDLSNPGICRMYLALLDARAALVAAGQDGDYVPILIQTDRDGRYLGFDVSPEHGRELWELIEEVEIALDRHLDE